MIKKIILLAISIAFTTNVFANPAPLGIELNKATLNDVKSKYTVISSIPNATNGYYNNKLQTQNIDIKTLTHANVISNKDEVVEGLVLTLSNSQFDEVYNSLASKYQLIEKNIPFVGDKFAEFQDGDCVIQLNAPHMSFTMTLGYATKQFVEQYTNRTNKELQEEKEKAKQMF